MTLPDFRKQKSTTVRTDSSRVPPPAFRLGMGALSRVAPLSAVRLADHLMSRPTRYRRPAWEKALLQTAWPTRLPTGAGHIAAVEWWADVLGPPGCAEVPMPTVLLVHGWEGRGSQLAALAPALVARGWRVLAFDAPGHGDSANIGASLPSFVTALREVADRLGPVHAVVAHSFGAMAAAAALQRGWSVDRAVLIGPGIWTEDTPRTIQNALGIDQRTMRRVMGRQALRTGTRWHDLMAERLYAGRSEPLFLIHDHDDNEIPIDRLPRLTNVWRPSATLLTHGLGHRRILRDPGVVQQVAEWLGEAPTR